MDIALIVGMSILIALGLGGIALMYSFTIYTRNRIFTKVKFPTLSIVILSVLLICLIVFLSLVCINYHAKPSPYNPAFLGLTITLMIFNIGYLIWFICVYIFNSKNKIDYFDIPNINWEEKEKQLIAKIGNIEQDKEALSKKDPKYYSSMLQYYKSIVSKLSQKNLPLSEAIADIVTFNDAFTHKWSTKINFLQLQLTYKFCYLLQKNPSQK